MINYLKNKKVIIVGPAGYLEGKSLGKYIDSFDVVIRLNYAMLNENYEDYGKRTDILYNYLSEDPHGCVDVLDNRLIKAAKESKAKYVVTTFSKQALLIDYKYKIGNDKKHIMLEREFFDSIKNNLLNAPNTGIVAITHLLTFGINSLNIIGFDFYNGGYQKGYLNQKGNNDKVHNNFSQLMYLDLLIKKDIRIKADSRLKEVISNNKKDVTIIIPFKSNEEQRIKLLNYNLERYKNIIPEAEVIVSGCGESKEWIKGKAVNLAVNKAKGNIIIIIDSDVVISKDNLIDLLKFAKGKRVVCLKGKKLDINEKSTEELLNKEISIIDVDLDKVMRWDKAVFCMTKDKFLKCKGFDERFEGWGGEELAFYKVLEIYFGKAKFIKGNMYHLWHKSQPTKEDYRTNKKNNNKRLLNLYKKAKTIKDLERIK